MRLIFLPSIAALALTLSVGCQQPAATDADAEVRITRADTQASREQASSPPSQADDEAEAPVDAEDADAAADDAADEAETDPEPTPLPLNEWQQQWTDLLHQAVHRRSGGVDYVQLAEHLDTITELRDALAEPRDFDSPQQELAFLINAYNLLTIAAVLDQPALPGTVRDVGGFFEGVRHEVLGRSYTLDDLRDEAIRPLGDARVHFALVNAAASAPPLAPWAYTAEHLDDQLDYQAGWCLTDPVRNTTIGPTLMISPTFRWFSEDFEAAAEDGTITGFIREYAPAGSRIGRLMEREASPAVSFLEFNWALNHVRIARLIRDDEDAPTPPDAAAPDAAPDAAEDAAETPPRIP